MSTPSLHIFDFITAKTLKELRFELLKIQSKEGGQVKVLTVTQDLKTKLWVCIYYPIQDFGSSNL
jgi:hypothetical protein